MKKSLKENRKEIRTSMDTIAKSDAKPLGQLLSKAKNRPVVQFWVDKIKIDKILKK